MKTLTIDTRLFEFLYEETDIVEFRLLANEEEREDYHAKSLFFTGGVPTSDLTELNAHYNIYFGINPRIEHSKSNVSNIVACYADIDAKNFSSKEEFEKHIKDKLAQLLEKGLQPSARVNSGHGQHWYWKLTSCPKIETVKDKEGKDVQECNAFRHTQQVIQKFVGGDSVQDLPRIFRVPGTMNIKEEFCPAKCEIVEITGLVYDLFDFQILEPEETPDIFKKNGNGTGDHTALHEAIIETLAQTSGVCDSYYDFIRLCMAGRSAGLPYEVMDPIFRGSANYDLAGNKKIYDGLKPKQISMKTAYYYAQQANPRLLSEKVREKLGDAVTEFEKIDGAQAENKKEKKSKKRTTEDYIHFLEDRGLSFRLNEMNDEIYLGKRRFDDVEAAKVRAIARDGFSKPPANLAHVSDAIMVMADRHRFHPIKDYFNGLKWDGIDRISEMCKCFVSDGNMFDRWTPIWMARTVLHAYGRGQNAMLTIDGPQDIGKSCWAHWICPLPDFFLASAIIPESKDCRLRLMNTLIWEVMELGSTTRRQDIDSLKAFLTLEEVKDRKPYGRFDIVKPAISSFVGTINNDAGFLVDRTGNRRFLVCQVKSINWREYIKLDKDQLWAQAKAMCDEGKHELTNEDKEDRESINEQFLIPDPVEELLAAYVGFTNDLNDFVSVPALMEIMKQKLGNVNRGTTMVIASFMAHGGAVKTQKRIGNTKPRGYCGAKLLDIL